MTFSEKNIIGSEVAEYNCHATPLYVICYPNRRFGQISKLSKAQSAFGNSDRRIKKPEVFYSAAMD